MSDQRHPDVGGPDQSGPSSVRQSEPPSMHQSEPASVHQSKPSSAPRQARGVKEPHD